MPIFRRWVLAILFLLVAPQVLAGAPFAYRPAGLKLYQANDVVESRIPGGPSMLGGYVHDVSGTLRQWFTQRPAGTGFSGAIVILARPGQVSRKWLVTSGPIPADLRALLQQVLDQIGAPAVQGGPFALALKFEAWGGDPAGTPPLQELPTPPEWAMALGRPAVFPVADADLDKVWK